MSGVMSLCWMVLLGLLTAVANGQIVVNIPNNATQCDPVSLSWSGGSPPYYLLLSTNASVPENLPSIPQNQTIVEGLGFGNIFDTAFNTSPYFPVGSNINFTVTDSTRNSSSIGFVLSAGSSAKCQAQFRVETYGNTDANQRLLLGQLSLEGDAYSCDPTQEVSWGGGTPPFTMSIRTVGLDIQQEQLFGGLWSISHTVQIAFPPGVTIVLAVVDSKRQVNIGQNILLIGEPDATDCVISNITTNNSSVPSPTASLPLPTFSLTEPSGLSSRTPYSRPYTSSSPASRVSPGIGAAIGIASVLTFFLIFCCAACKVKRDRRRILPPLRPSHPINYTRIVPAETDIVDVPVTNRPSGGYEVQEYVMPQLNRSESRRTDIPPPYRRTTEHDLPSYDQQIRE